MHDLTQDLTQDLAHDPTAGPANDRAQARRDFLRVAGLGGAALALAACGADPTRVTQLGAAAERTAAGGTLTFDFSTDVGVLNFGYVLEQLGAALYSRVTALPQFGSLFPANVQRILSDFRDHEIAHREFFRNFLGSAAIPDLTFNFSSIDSSSASSILGVTRTLENTCVGALNGSARYLKSVANVAIGGKLVSVEARHASAVNDVLSPRSGAFAPSPFDQPIPPRTVASIAQPYVVEKLVIINA